MRKIKVIAGQTLFDIAVQVYGNVRAAISIAIANKISITSDLTPGVELYLPISEFNDIDISNAFSGVNKRVATALTKESSSELTGLDYVLPGILPLSL